MILINLAFLKSANGMFWYANDKIATLPAGTQATILADVAMAAMVRELIPQYPVIATSSLGSLWLAARYRWRGDAHFRLVIFTPHPLPLCHGQTIAFYDDYPFHGVAGAVKRVLFMLGTRSSRCRVGIINRSLALPFLRGCGIADAQIFFDSAFPALDLTNVPPRSAMAQTPMRIGLVGTNSTKKNYDAIFMATRQAGLQGQFHFVIYGAANDYTARLQRDFPDVIFDLISSDDISLIDYFTHIDYLISAATNEGYGRPMGIAAVLGIPMFLLRSPVFEEFFSDVAMFFETVSEMIAHLDTHRPSAVRPVKAPPSEHAAISPFFIDDAITALPPS